MLFGAKRWFLRPPSRATYSRVHTATWAREILPNLKVRAAGKKEISQSITCVALVGHVNAQGGDRPFECTQRQGDLMYVPEAWGHAVLNLAEAVGYAGEFSHGHPPDQDIESPVLDREIKRKERIDKLRKKNRKLR